MTADTLDFDLYAAIRRLPKAELHCHLDGSLRASTLLDLSREQGRPLPVATPDALADWMRVDDARNLADYLARFDVTLAVMQDVASLERIAHELVLDASADGVHYIEVRFCPELNMRGGLSADVVLDAVLRGLARGESDTGTVARAIVCALRSFAAPHSQAMAELAVAYRHRGVVAFDLAGGEAGNPARDHAAAFEFARNNDLAVTVHAGEGSGAASIRQAVHDCGANRIGHGTRLHEDLSLESYVIDRQIPLEVCPTSNVQTRVANSFAEHPVLRYLRLGAAVTINTDNRMMSGVTLTDEYYRCARYLGLSLSDLATLALASFDAAFVDYGARRALRSEAASEIQTLFANLPSAASTS